MDTTTNKPLTDQQHRVLAFVQQFLQEHGFPPTLREIGEAIGLANVNAVRGHLAALERKGYITKAPDKARSIQIVRAPSALSQLKRKLHEVLGTDEGVLHHVVYGLAWATRQRAGCLTGLRARWIEEALEHEAVERGWTVLEARVEPDHVVVVVQTWHDHSAQRVVHRLQAAGQAARRRHPGEFPEGPLWGKGYVATTDLELLDELVGKLLDNQTQQEGDRDQPS
jgi:REP element-mobilizing transposase RayT